MSMMLKPEEIRVLRDDQLVDMLIERAKQLDEQAEAVEVIATLRDEVFRRLGYEVSET